MTQYIKQELFKEWYNNLRHYSTILFDHEWNDETDFYRCLGFEDADGRKSQVLLKNGEVISIETEECNG